ncbi:MAG: MltR family transcriptional regulator [Planctomycetota bacterium]
MGKQTAKSSAKKRLRTYAREVPPDAAVQAVFMALEPQHNAYADHAIAVIGASYVEKALEAAIAARLVPMPIDDRAGLFDYNQNGPMAELSARIKMARALGIVGPKTYADLERIREIRNHFAHAVRLLKFEQAAVADLCDELHTPKVIRPMDRMLLALGDEDTPRRRYIETVLILVGWLKSSLAVPRRGVITKQGFVHTAGGLLD